MLLQNSKVLSPDLRNSKAVADLELGKSRLNAVTDLGLYKSGLLRRVKLVRLGRQRLLQVMIELRV